MNNLLSVGLLLLFAIGLLLPVSGAADHGDTVFADFEGTDYGAWKVEGTAFGSGPAQGTLPTQMPVAGFAGHGLASSFYGKDDAQGRLISPEFVINKRYITFLIGGGGYAGKTCINLVVDGKVLRTATGPNVTPGGSENLALDGWDVRELRTVVAHIEIVDAAQGGWGHINVDQIVFTDTEPTRAPKPRTNVTHETVATDHWLLFPIKNGANKRTVTVRVDGQPALHFDIELADGPADWQSPLDIQRWRGKTISYTIDRLPGDSKALSHITQSDAFPNAAALYQEPLRPQFHFTARRGWLNDPNGLSYYDGQYHLFFQHSPFTWGDGAKWWGHAVSRDLVHWTEIEEALAPDTLGAIWSGSGVADHHNTSGLGQNGKDPLALIYTAAGGPFTQCLASSTDGHTVTKYAHNPVIPNISGDNRDPRVFWYAPTHHWVLALWVGENGRNTIHLLTSPNLRDWTAASVVNAGPNNGNYLYECPDLFELPLDGDKKHTRWVLTAANGEYAVGAFDGKTFTPEASKLPGSQGRGFYAAQTFNDEPQGRRVQIGWFQTDTPGMPFNQSLSLPMELRLISTPHGPRLTWTPVKELESLRAKAHKQGDFTLSEGAPNPLASVHSDLLEMRAQFTPATDGTVTFTVRGVPIVYDAKAQTLSVHGSRAAVPLRPDGRQTLTVYADRTGLEIFADDGLTFVPMPINLDPAETSLSVSTQGGPAKFSHLDAYELRSAWDGVK